VESRKGAAGTSIDKALQICEALSHVPGGMSLAELSRALKQPRSSVHRLLGVLRRRNYVRQDEESGRYSLTLKMLDLSFRALGRSELRLHAYPVLRDYAQSSGQRTFIAIPAEGEVSYVWSAGADEVAMRSAYAKEMPAHCSLYFDPKVGTRRLSCLRLERPADVSRSEHVVLRLGSSRAGSGQRLFCTCAPVRDYTGREVARIGVFGHGPDDKPILIEHNRGAWELARHVSARLGHLPAVTQEVPA
jgi:DNA-binding transcriptional ArsR family regulator